MHRITLSITLPYHQHDSAKVYYLLKEMSGIYIDIRIGKKSGSTGRVLGCFSIYHEELPLVPQSIYKTCENDCFH